MWTATFRRDLALCDFQNRPASAGGFLFGTEKKCAAKAYCHACVLCDEQLSLLEA